MTDQWDGWPDPELPDDAGTGADGGYGDGGLDPHAGDGLEPEPAGTAGFGPADEDGDVPLWYSDEPGPDADGGDLTGGDTPDGTAGFGAAADAGEVDAELGPAAPDGPTDPDGAPTPDDGAAPGWDPPPGADPDLVGEQPYESEAVFPVPLDFEGTVEPVDGYPWADADLLGDVEELRAGAGDPLADAGGVPPVADLFAYTGEAAPASGSGWSALLASADPATSSLARFWAPHTLT